jgi:hypothetical protein
MEAIDILAIVVPRFIIIIWFIYLGIHILWQVLAFAPALRDLPMYIDAEG